MPTVEDRLHALSTAPAPAPPSLGDLRARTRVRHRHRAAAAAGAIAVLAAAAVPVWSALTGPDGTPDVAVVPSTSVGDPCPGTQETTTEDPVALACQALQHYDNDGPPAAVRLGRVDTDTFQDWWREHTGAIGSINGPPLPDTVTVLLVRASSGELWAPSRPPGASGRLSGDTVYVVFAGGLSPESVRNTGTGTWSDILASPWAQALDEVDIG